MSKFEFRKKILNELDAMTNQAPAAAVRLTDTQKTVLLGIYAAPTPEAAYDSTQGSENTVQARQQLRSMGLVNVDDNSQRAGVTDAGQDALVNASLIDETGQATEDGDAILQSGEEVKDEFNDSTNENYKILKTLI